LDLDAAPYEPRYPVVCVEEQRDQLVSDVRQPLPLVPGKPGRYDYAYQRRGTWHVCRLFEPLPGWRHVKVTDRRTARDVADGMKALGRSIAPRRR
jgi:hypothetical protein